MDNIGAFLDAQPFIALFLVVALGYVVGQISIAGFSLGAGAVLFVGLAVGAIAPHSAPTGLIGTLGLVLFVYGVGIQYGKDFFKGLASPFGIKANLLATVAILAGCAVAVTVLSPERSFYFVPSRLGLRTLFPPLIAAASCLIGMHHRWSSNV